MAYRTTIGWSLISSGIVTLLLEYLPYPSLYWGIGLLVLVFSSSSRGGSTDPARPVRNGQRAAGRGPDIVTDTRPTDDDDRPPGPAAAESKPAGSHG